MQVLKKIKAVTPSQRGLKLLRKDFLCREKRLKSKSIGLLNRAGRNNFGRITAFHRGGGCKRSFRRIDFFRTSTNGIVETIEYDPNRTAFISRIFDPALGKHFYILAPKNLFVGSVVKSGDHADVKLGHSLPLLKIPQGSLVHNLSTGVSRKGQYARSAGNYAQLLQKTRNYARVRFSSGEQRLVPLNAMATLGVVSNENNKLLTLGKAGRSRWLNRRPHVRGVAMNPVDHPHGGGEGKTSGGRPSVTPWGKPTKGPKTSRSKNPLRLLNNEK